MSIKKLSIVVVSLNTKNDFIKTIKSIQNQKYEDYEIIVVDGDSSDGTYEEILKKKKIFSKIIIEKDKGIYHAMNKGIIHSNGKWVMFLNSGDILYKSSTLKSIFDSKIDTADVIYSDTIISKNNFKYYSIGNELKKNTVVMPFCHQSSIVKRDLLIKNLFDLNFKLSADFNLYLKLYNSKKSFRKIDTIISLVKGGGVSDTHRQKVFDENIKILVDNNLTRYLLKLYFLKFFEFIKKSIKFILPKRILIFILKIKYIRRVI